MTATELVKHIQIDQSTIDKKDFKQPIMMQTAMSNVVSEDKLKTVQKNTLNRLKEYLAKTYGPMGSYTSIITGSSANMDTKNDSVLAEYSKDGLKVLKHIIFDSPIEVSIQSEVRDICAYVERKVGDGTTSAVILSALVYQGLLDVIESNNVPPRKLVKVFKSIVDECKDMIEKSANAFTINTAYDISMISTNGNEEVSNQIKSIYEQYGTNVQIDVGISNDQYTKIKTYDGLTVGEGYSDPAYVNNIENTTADIHDASIYAFEDPIDTPEMTSFMAKIIFDNITGPASSNEPMIPTVITAPIIGKDASSELAELVNTLYQYNKIGKYSQKPPILIITNLTGTDEAIALDITRLCNCRYIKKYINPDIQKADQEKGLAPTLDTIHNFAGHCELVSADRERTKFINPDGMVKDPGTYESLVAFLESELKNAEAANDDKVEIGRLKKRLQALKANLVEYLVGGISISDRNSLKDLVEDATKNCASAAENGVGKAANFEAFSALYTLRTEEFENRSKLEQEIIIVLYNAYYNAANILYSTVVSSDKVPEVIDASLERAYPFNVMDLFESDGDLNKTSTGSNVMCSIRTDIEILDAISKIITMMVTSNQCLLQATNLNRY